MLNEAFLRDFFRMPPKAEKPEPAAARTITVNCQAADPLEVRAENIVAILGYARSEGRCYSSPLMSPEEATLRVLKVLRKYQEQDSEK